MISLDTNPPEPAAHSFVVNAPFAKSSFTACLWKCSTMSACFSQVIDDTQTRPEIDKGRSSRKIS